MIVFPSFRSIPAFDIGTPVARLMFCLISVIPSARFHEKLRPGIGVVFLLIWLQICAKMFYIELEVDNQMCISKQMLPLNVYQTLSFQIIHRRDVNKLTASSIA